MSDDQSNDRPTELPTTPEGEGLSFIHWDEEAMATGVATIDEQHKQLIDHLNELYRAHRAGAEPEDIRKIVMFLGKYAETHFRHEESIMDERRCPVRRENRLAHAKFLREYNELAFRFSIEEDSDLIVTEIEHMIGRWLSSHICRIDVGLRDCQRAPKDSPKASQ